MKSEEFHGMEGLKQTQRKSKEKNGGRKKKKRNLLVFQLSLI